jgi:ABC-type proline/glycine betaine transport system permease subunit
MGMWAMFMVVLGINLVAHVNPGISALISAIVAGGLGQVLPTGKDGKRVPMQVAAGLMIVGLILIVVSFLLGGKKK